jgi:hypothetical protein
MIGYISDADPDQSSDMLNRNSGSMITVYISCESDVKITYRLVSDKSQRLAAR